MNIDCPGIGMNFDHVPLGGFFMSVDGSSEVGIRVSEGEKDAVVSFGRADAAWPQVYLVRNLPRTVLSFPDAILRPDIATASSNGSVLQVSLFAIENQFYIRAYEGEVNYSHFSLETGKMENPRAWHKAIYFSKWRVGSIIDQHFQPLVSFPLGAES